ncbi:23S rRNA (adenine2030-N6)-methyltransferase [Aidingimonas halophila]|uniref:Ribosomal RNA large subunit methyltransferase J n=2 Tax=Aidingimonas halophila TaxID=574349 RepID=A0A1H2XQ15_9GAMM|nr:23S rRNA (adenine(2030)-N(6))-methyltransferase RlmJ [Aidingimonas halophila]SDW94594.1 23S rRNA (adenine2030-N6)-methyltransferase [Aidingimonas halophila]
MLSYQHAFHVGNMADVHKHLALHAVIQHMHRKASAVTYIDTHAGRGLYPLDAPETRKLAEYRQGVELLWKQQGEVSKNSLLKTWLASMAPLQQMGGDGGMTHYPGSPWWLVQGLRAQDRLHLYELHPGEHAHLGDQPLPDNAQRHHDDGLKGILRLMPVDTPRVCALIDPSYERKGEYVEVAETLHRLSRKARHAIALVWYPLLPAGHHHELLDRLRDTGMRKLWRSQLYWRSPETEARGMYGSGLLVFNPPWGLDARLDESLGIMLSCLPEEAGYQADWWVGE